MKTRLQSYEYHIFYSGGSFGVEKVRIDASGNVGSGTSSPDYTHPTLDQVRSYIQQNRHLPEIKSTN